MATNLRPKVRDRWSSFNKFNRDWHKTFKEKNPHWKKSEMYLNGQFDELPYWAWDENRFVDEVWNED